jgi:integrase/recombinase XerD
MSNPMPRKGSPGTEAISKEEFQRLARMPSESEWFANIENENTRRAYRNDLRGFMAFAGIDHAERLREVTRAHVIAWRKKLKKDKLSPASIRRKLAALGSLFAHLCECNAVDFSPVIGVERPKEGLNEGKTPAISNKQAEELLNAPDTKTLKGLRDRAIIAVLLYHAFRRAELASLRINDYTERRGIRLFRVYGKGGKIRFIPEHCRAVQFIEEYLDQAGHRKKSGWPLFRPVHRSDGKLDRPLSENAIYSNVVIHYARKIGLHLELLGPHALRATAATNALENGSDITKVQEWLGHANIATTRLYDRRKGSLHDSPTFKVNY